MQEQTERPPIDLPHATIDPATGGLPIESCVESHGDVDVLRLSGHLDLVTSNTLKDRVRERLSQQRRSLVLNLEEVNFLNSSGLGALVSILKDVRSLGGQLVLCSLAPYIKEIFHITQLSNVFEIYPDQESAVSFFARACTPSHPMERVER